MDKGTTNKTKLLKGLQTLGITLVALFLGPILLHAGLGNMEKPLHYPLIVIGIIVCIAAIYAGFKGFKTIQQALFDK